MLIAHSNVLLQQKLQQTFAQDDGNVALGFLKVKGLMSERKDKVKGEGKSGV